MISDALFLFLQELEDIRKSGIKHFRNLQVDESNVLSWQGLIVPVSEKFINNEKTVFHT